MSQATTLSSTYSAKVSSALKLSSQLQEKREDELVGLPTDAIQNESGLENESSSPIFDRFYANGGSQTEKLLTLDDKKFNATFLSICIIVEKNFSHLTKRWGVVFTKYKLTEEGYDEIFCLCVGITNFHVSYHPLCDKSDANHYNQCKNCNYFIGEKIARNCKASQKKYCEQCRRHICLDTSKSCALGSSDSSLSSNCL